MKIYLDNLIECKRVWKSKINEFGEKGKVVSSESLN